MENKNEKILRTTIIAIAAVLNLNAANSTINIRYIKLSGYETTTATMASPEEEYNELLAAIKNEQVKEKAVEDMVTMMKNM